QSMIVLDTRFNRDWTIVRVYTDEGIVGTGEACSRDGVKLAIQQHRERLIGKDPLAVDARFSTMMGPTSVGGSKLQAASGIEIALWDIVGQYYGCPVYQFLGGKHRDTVPCYADCGPGNMPLSELNALITACEEAVAAGF